MLLFSRFQGSITMPTMAATKPPRRMLMNRGNNAVRSHPALMLFAEMFVPIWAMTNAAEINHTPKRVACEGPSSRKRSRRSMGDQIVSLKMACEDDETIMPMNDTSENVMGTAKNCGQPAAEGRFARDAKSGAFLRSR